MAEQGPDELDGAGVRPLDVVEGKDERLRSGEVLEERADGSVRAVALVLERNLQAAAERGQ
jgi:hypothetical protein